MEIEHYNRSLNEIITYIKSDSYHLKPSDQNYLIEQIEKLMSEINLRFCHEGSLV